uniref:Uncharacterized protein n=1 Tax=Romanomermis culicivorax TaxID=13658 RepID=A0A915IIF0_ROMCU
MEEITAFVTPKECHHIDAATRKMETRPPLNHIVMDLHTRSAGAWNIMGRGRDARIKLNPEIQNKNYRISLKLHDNKPKTNRRKRKRRKPIWPTGSLTKKYCKHSSWMGVPKNSSPKRMSQAPVQGPPDLTLIELNQIQRLTTIKHALLKVSAD